jgi:elongation factor P
MAVYVNAGSVRVGYTLKYNNQLWRVMTFDTVKPGKGGSYAQLKLRNLIQGNQTEVRLRTEEKIERAVMEQLEMQYLYEDTAGHCFMNTKTYEQVFFPPSILEGTLDFLAANMTVTVEYHEGKPIGVDLPRVVELVVTETDPTLKTATVTSSFKPAILETGKVLSVPPFIEIGQKIKIDTIEGRYLERAKE